MQFVAYWLVYPILWFISKLPWRIFYLFSTLCYCFIYHIIGYRKKVVLNNLQLTFPDKSITELKVIRRRFYQHMCDMFLEMIKSISISENELLKRFRITNLEELHALEAKEKSIIVLMGHYASYEWCNVTQLVANHETVGIYKEIKNPYFDKLVHRIRHRFDSRLITSKQTIKEIIRDKARGHLCSYGMVADQSPKIEHAKFWTQFMGIEVPAFTGGEALARKLDLPVCYLHVEKIKRGYYEAKFILITDTPKACNEFEITKKYLQLLEKQIREAPQYYLWTHKRWKHRNTPKPKGAITDSALSS